MVHGIALRAHHMDLTRSYSIRSPHAPHGPSLLLAVACTGVMLAAAFLAGTAVSHRWWESDVMTRPAEERVTYVAPPVAVPPPASVRPAVPTAPTVPGRAAVPTAPAAPSSAGTSVTAPTVTAPSVAPVAGVPGDTAAAGRGPKGAAGAAVRGPTQSPMPLRVGAELPASPPLSRAQKDSVLQLRTRELFGNPTIRAEAVAMAAEAQAKRDEETRRELGRTVGGGQPRAHGLQLNLLKIPFGGPSPEQRKRDSIVDADTRARLAAAADRRTRQIANALHRDSARTLADSVGWRPLRRDSL
jgi:hypothetical protein